MAVPAPPMSRATSSQHPATTASATADGAEAEEAVVEATDRAEGVVEASEAALAPPAPQPPAGHADLLVAMLTGALRAVAGGGHMHYHVRVLAGRPSCVDCGQRTDWECCCDGTPALCGPNTVDDVMGVGEDPVGEDGMDIDAPAWPPAGVEPAMRA
eukprot:jgi/Tetstr1/432558/TSEL_021929.t1